MQIKNNTNVGGYLGLTPIPTSDFAAITPPASGVGTIANDATLNALVRWDGTAWQPFASTSDEHPAVTLAATGQQWLTLDAAGQVVGLLIPDGGIGDNLLTEAHYTEAEVDALIATAKQETKDEIIDGADGTWDTLAEIAAELEADNAQANTILANIASNDADIAALQADSHVAATVAAGSDTELTITGQELNLDLSGVKAQVNSNSTGIGNNLNAINVNEADIAAIETVNTNQAAQIAANTTQSNTNATDIAALQSDSHDALTLSASVLAGGYASLNGQELDIDFANLEDQISDNTSLISDNEANIQDNADDIETNETSIANLDDSQIAYSDGNLQATTVADALVELETLIQANTNLRHDALVVADTMENPGLVLNDSTQEIYLADLDLAYDLNTREISHSYNGDSVILPLATPLNDGLMTAGDKFKLENIAHLCEDFAISDWVAVGNQYTYTFSDTLIEPGLVYNVRVVDTNGDAVIVDNKENSGNVTLTVNGIPDCRFGGRVYVTLNLEATI